MLATTLLCRVVGVADGDTIKVRCGEPGRYEQRSIRLSAIDAPEKAQPFGQRSKQALSDLCFQQQATIRTVNIDRYGRTVADVQCRGTDAGAAQVRAGMAWVYRQYAKGYDGLYPIEQDAKSSSRGLWRDPQPVPPWEWQDAAKAGRAPMVSDSQTCHVGLHGGRYKITADGRKQYGCSSPQ